MENIQFDSEQFKYAILIYLLLQSEENKWDCMRKLACNEINKTKIYDYFSSLFSQYSNDEIITANSHFFRARQIKEDNVNKLGINKIQTKEYELLQKECDKINASNIGITISISDFLLSKLVLNDEQKNEIMSKGIALLDQLKTTKFLGFDAENSGLPPKNKRKEGRLNTSDDAFLYLSYDYETSLGEMKSIIDQKYSIAECVTTKELKIANLYKCKDQHEENLFTKFYLISKKVSEPNTEPNPKNESFYKITQMLAHFIKSKGYDGISFKSSIIKNGINLVLFDANNVKFINSKIFVIKSIKIDFENYFDIADSSDLD